MRILPLHPELRDYLKKRNLVEKFAKQKRIFEQNPFHPGLNTELLSPKRLRFWSFRIDRKYRAIFIFRGRAIVEIIDINDHYQ
jgi:Txe/YoeB family toxin of Txe-Axe toxin-antitoxin module